MRNSHVEGLVLSPPLVQEGNTDSILMWFGSHPLERIEAECVMPGCFFLSKIFVFSLGCLYVFKLMFIFIYVYILYGVELLGHQFSSVAQLCPTLCDPMNHSTPGLPVHHQLPQFTQTHAHRVGDTIQPSHPLLSPSPPAPNPSQHQGLFQWVSSWHEVAKELEFQHQSFQWIPSTDLL